MPKISVVIPAYNAMAYLPETVESVIKQTFTDLEVLIINDGSSDQIVQWVSQLTDPRIKLISQEKQGVSGARNTGITHAQGEYIAFLDADDIWELSKLEKQLQCFQVNPSAGVVYTWTVLVDEYGKPTGRIFASQAEGNVWIQLLETDVISNCSSAMVRQDCFEVVGLFDRSLTLAEDLDMWLRITEHYPFAVVKEPLTLYRQYSTSISKNRQRMFQNLQTVIDKAFKAAPSEKLHYRNRAYASITLNQAWWSLDEGDYKAAKAWQQQAISYNPQIRFWDRCIRLSLAIALIRWFGPQGYDGIRILTRRVRQIM